MDLIEVLRLRRYLDRHRVAFLPLHRHGAGFLIHCHYRDDRLGDFCYDRARLVLGKADWGYEAETQCAQSYEKLLHLLPPYSLVFSTSRWCRKQGNGLRCPASLQPRMMQQVMRRINGPTS